MRKQTFAALGACLLVAGCETLESIDLSSLGDLARTIDLGRLLSSDDEKPTGSRSKTTGSQREAADSRRSYLPHEIAGRRSGYLAHDLTASERAAVVEMLSSAIQTPVSISGLKSSHHPTAKVIAVCGYASNPNQPSMPPALFAAYLTPNGNYGKLSDAAAAFIDKSKGQDPPNLEHVVLVRADCATVNISI